MKKLRTRPTIVICFPLALIGSPAPGSVVYSQPSAGDDNRVGRGWYSSSEPRPTRSFLHADNFVLDGDGSIGSVRWWGLSEGLSHTDLSNFDSFTIGFYTSRTLPNGSIRPRDLIASETLTLSETNATATGRSAPGGALEYMHEAALSDAVSLLGGETYWVSISARSTDPSADAWQWQDSDDYDTRSSSFDYNQNRWLAFEDTDSAFELIAVPTPGAWAGFMTMGLLSQRRRRASR